MGDAENLTEMFLSFVNKARRFLGFEPFVEVPRKVVVGNVSSGGRWVGSEFRDDILVVSRDLLSEFALLKGILARDAFRLFIPKELLNIEQSADLAWEFARLQLRGEDRRKWINFWQDYTEPLVIRPSILYYPPICYVQADKLSDGSFLSDIMVIFKELSKQGVILTSEEFASLIVNRISFYSVTLTPRVARVISILYENPDVSFKDLSRRLGVSIPYLSRLLSPFRKLGVFDVMVVPRFAALNFETWFVYMLPEIERKRFIEEIRKFPFLFSLHRLITGDRYFMAVFVVPRNFEIQKWVKDRLDDLDLLDLKIFKRKSFCRSLNFNFYDFDEGRWRNFWDYWELWFTRLIEKEEYKAMLIKEVILPEGPPVYLDRKDIEILKVIWEEKHTNRRKLQKVLRMNMNQLNKRIKRLIDHGVLTKHVFVSNIGLDGCILFYGETNPEEHKALISGFKDLPRHDTSRVYSEESGEEGTLSFIFLPEHSLASFSQVFTKILDEWLGNEFFIHVRDLQPISVIWTFNPKYWNERRQNWDKAMVEDLDI